jgi:uncharacterized protein (DUF2252 family)
VAAIIAFNRRFVAAGRDPVALELKLRRLSDSELGFLRGTFHLYVADFQAADVAPLAFRAQPVVGDVHLENLGAYRAADGQVVFDVNDFDEAGKASPLLDLTRFAASIALARAQDSDALAVAGITAFLEGWYQGVAGADEPRWPRAVRELLVSAAEVRRGQWLTKRVETARTGERRFRSEGKAKPKYERVLEPSLRAAIEAGAARFGRSCAQRPSPGWPVVLDVALRRAGTGSLGRKRWAVLIAGHKPGAKERVLELKEAFPSALRPTQPGNAAERVIALQRRLQAAPPMFIGATHIASRPYTVRELQPTEAKVDISAASLDMESLCHASGGVLGRLHRRGAISKQALLLHSQRSLTRIVAAFALRYADTVSADHARFCAQLARARAALGLR